MSKRRIYFEKSVLLEKLLLQMKIVICARNGFLRKKMTEAIEAHEKSTEL